MFSDLPAEVIGRRSNPLDEAGVRGAAAALVAELLDAYPRASDDERGRVRVLFGAHGSFASAAGFLLPLSSDPPTLRPQVLPFPLLDQGADSRDALLWLRAFCRQKSIDRVVLTPVLREVAALSSRVDRYGMGSTETMLLAVAADLDAR